MTWTKQVTKTLPPTGNRTVTLTTVDGVQQVHYHAVDTSGEGYDATFTVAEVLLAHPEIDAATLNTTLGIFRSFGDAACGFTNI